jgi:hypothetical protein
MAALRKKPKLSGRGTSQSFVETPFGFVARQVGLDVRRYHKTEGRSAALGSSRSPEASCLGLLEMGTEKKGSIVCSSTTDEGPAGNGGTRL